MGRTAKHNWQKLYLEYCQGRYKSTAEFAVKKGLSYDVLRKQFKRLSAGHDQGEKTGHNRTKKPDKKTDRTKKSTPWEKLKAQFTDWPEEKRQAYLVQLETRLAELSAIPFEELSPEEQKELPQLRRERRAILSDPDPDRICTAHRHDGQPCGNPAERGRSVCWVHGGAPGTGAPAGNRNGLRHGFYETIWLDQLDEEERGLADQVAQDKIKALEEEIVLLTIRERRMLARIARLTGKDFTVVKIRYEKGESLNGCVDKENREEQATLGQIQTIEEHLTKVQEKKLKALELKHKMEPDRSGEPGSDNPFAGLTTEELKKLIKDDG